VLRQHQIIIDVVIIAAIPTETKLVKW